MDVGQIIIAIVLAAVSGGFISNLLNLRKTRSEADFNAVKSAEAVIEMMKDQHDEQKAWYDLRIGMLQEEVTTLKAELALVKEQVSTIRKQA